MRASYLPDLLVQETYVLRGDQAHHLVNVVRIEAGEEILLLNGKGLKVRTQVQAFSKREIQLAKIDHEEATRAFNMDLALGIPKKDALELSLKQSVELGFRKIFLIRSRYSQTRLPEADRLHALLVSALEQSNSAFLPEVSPTEWKDLATDAYTGILLMDSQNETQARAEKNFGESLLIVGPEGGFSSEELTFLHQLPKICVVHLPTPILRTPTAVATGAGILLGSLLD